VAVLRGENGVAPVTPPEKKGKEEGIKANGERQ
jgi:hypothetical protein